MVAARADVRRRLHADAGRDAARRPAGLETLKSLLGNAALALDTAIYGLLLILFIIYMPKGILGTGTDWWRRWRKRKAKSPRLDDPCSPLGLIKSLRAQSGRSLGH